MGFLKVNRSTLSPADQVRQVEGKLYWLFINDKATTPMVVSKYLDRMCVQADKDFNFWVVREGGKNGKIVRRSRSKP
jgi:hypothetical protein